MAQHGAGKRTLLHYFKTRSSVDEDGAATEIRPRSSLDTATGTGSMCSPSEIDTSVGPRSTSRSTSSSGTDTDHADSDITSRHGRRSADSECRSMLTPQARCNDSTVRPDANRSTTPISPDVAPGSATRSRSRSRPRPDIDSQGDEPVEKKRKHDFMQSWMSTRPWLESRCRSETCGSDSKTYMFCSWCIASSKSNAFTNGCDNFRTSTLQRHVTSKDHIEAMQDINLREEMGEAAKTARDHKEDAIIRAMQAAYWMAKEDIASLKYESLLQFLEIQGVDLKSMSVGGNASYKSRATVDEFQVRENIFAKVY